MPKRKDPANVLSDGIMDMTLGGRIFACREKSGLSTEMLSSLLGVRPATLKAWENDRSEPRVNKIVALAGILGVSPTYFLAEEGFKGGSVGIPRGRAGKLLQKLKQEMAEIDEEQKQLTRRLHKIKLLVDRL